MNGHADMVKLLLDWDADVETRASDGRNPLDIAIESGSVLVTITLVQNNFAQSFFETKEIYYIELNSIESLENSL